MGIGSEFFPHGSHRIQEVGTHAVHLVDESEARNIVFVHLPPDRFGLRLNSLYGGKDAYGTIQHTKGPLHFCGEVDVAGRIDDIYAVVDACSWAILGCPFARNCGGRNGYSSLTLLFHPVGGSISIVNFTDLVHDS